MARVYNRSNKSAPSTSAARNLPSLFEVIAATEQRIPLSCAESWDPVGLICGNGEQKFRGMVIGVDLTESLLEMAIQKKANLIAIHHPPLFPKGKGLTRLIAGSPNDTSTLLLEAFKQNIGVYVAHTNFDRCALDGMMALAEDLGAIPTARLWEQPADGQNLLKKLVTFIPKKHFDTVRAALVQVGCGHIGNYDSCGFSSVGTGTFRALDGASPFIGKPGETESVEEVRLETVIVRGMEPIVIETLKAVHPYEEVAYDLFPVEQSPPQLGLIWGLGYGFVGKLSKPVKFETFINQVKKVFKIHAFTSNLHNPDTVETIAFSPGKGSSFVQSAKSQNVDVYITGEVGYHDSTLAARNGLSIFELGHRESEHYFLKTIGSWCEEWKLPHFTLDERTQRIQ